MEVICKDYKNCSNRDNCLHSKIHNIIDGHNNVFMDCTVQDGSVDVDCLCSVKSARKYKLEILKKI